MVKYFRIRYRNHILLSTPKYSEYARLIDMLKIVGNTFVEMIEKVKK